MATRTQNFTGTLRVQQTDPVSNPVFYNLNTSYRSVDTVSGTARAKPKRWKSPTPYSRTKSEVKSSLGLNLRYEQARLGGNSGMRQDFNGTWAVYNPQAALVPIPSSYQALLNQCLRDMNDQKFNLLTSIAEFRKTAEHLAETASRITRAVVDVKRGNFRRAASRLGIVKPKGASRSKTWSKNWLEYKYGWMPLILDAYGVMEHLASYYQNEAPIYKVRKRARDVGRLEIPDTVHNWNSWEVVAKHRVNYEVTRQVILYYQVDYSSLANLNRLGLLNPSGTAWELVPWSFVADWFLPVGEYLQLSQAWQGMIFKGGCHTTMIKSTKRSDLVKGRYTKPSGQVLFNTATQSTPGVAEHFALTRTVINDPKYRIAFKNPVSVSHAVSAIALMRQQFR